MELSGQNLLFVLTFFNFLLIFVFTLFVNKGNSISNKLFSFFVFSKTLCFSTDFLYHNFEFVYDKFTNFFFVGVSFELLLGPLLLFYIRSLIYKDFKFTTRNILHLIPFFVHVIYMFVIYYSKTTDIKKELLLSGSIYTSMFNLINNLFVYLFFVAYSIVIIYEVWLFNRNINNKYAGFDSIHLQWMLFLVSIPCLIWILGIFNSVTWFLHIDFYIPLYFFLVSIFLISNVIFFYGMYYQSIFRGLAYSDIKPKYEKNEISEKIKNELLDKLLYYVESKKPFLQPDLSLKKLAENTEIPSHQISQILNSKLNKNFFEFISFYRVKESVDQLSQPQNKDKTVLEILYEVGFNSKSAFNNAFKKHTGITPTEYKKVLPELKFSIFSNN